VVIIRKTILKDAELPYELDEGTAFTHFLGSFLNKNAKRFNQLFRKGQDVLAVDYEHLLAARYERRQENRAIINRSMSFGLLLFCIGLLLTLVYLVIVAIYRG